MEYIDELMAAVNTAATRLRLVSEEDAARRPAPGKWSPKEILGHLIDSAANNHQRFVRANWQDELTFQGYDQEAWVALHQYQTTPWPALLDLWASYNHHLARVMRATPEAVRLRVHTRHNLHEMAWTAVPLEEPTSLDYFMRDYVGHLQHHLRQIDALLLPGER